MKSQRKIPATMVTQHPDHAHTPYWHYRPFISTQEEPYECYLSFKDLNADEYMWDWEGKLVDESVLERILSEYFDYFQTAPLGQEKFITFRLPNPKVETEFRLGRAFMGIMAASGLAHKVGLPTHPLFEVILPMTESTDEMIAIQEAFKEIASLKHPLLKHHNETIEHIELIPLFEELETIAYSDKLLDDYVERHQKIFGFKPAYIRPFIARSDPALNAGIVPTVLSIKIGLSRYHDFSKRHHIPLYPIIGAASLPFRGGISPRTVSSFLKEYKGIRTTTIQSGFRYDYPKEEVIEALQKIEKEIKKGEAEIISPEEEKKLWEIMKIFEGFYQATIEKIAPTINQIAASMPKRRERVQHVGLFGYSRGVGKVKLPRAIGFTASLYSLGVPPELIGTGRGLKAIIKQNMLGLLEKYYLNIRVDLLNSIKYLNHDVLATLSRTNPGFAEIAEDVKEIEKFLKYEDYSLSEEHKQHQEVSQSLLQYLKEKKEIQHFIEKSALLRKSLG